MNNKLRDAINEAALYFCRFPKYIKEYIDRKKVLNKANKYRGQILDEKDAILDVLPDALPAIKFIEKQDTITVYNAEFERISPLSDIKVIYDIEKALKFVEVDNKRLYYSNSYSNRHIAYTYQCVWYEQSVQSPHRYLDDGEDLRSAVLFDCGSAEGNLSFTHIEEINHAYLFEGDNSWIKPLNATFEPWKDKTTIVNNFLGKAEGQLSLREYIEELIESGELDCEHDRVFIKMDVEGAEPELIDDISPLLKIFRDIRLAVCVYHHKDDEAKVISSIPEGFTYRVRPGYMFYYHYEAEPVFPYFRHGLIRIERESK